MAKIVSAQELAGIVEKLLTDPKTIAEQLDSSDKYSRFMEAVAQVVCDACGGDVNSTPEPAAGDMGEWFVGIVGSESSPEDGGIWSSVDPEGDLFAGAPCGPKG